MTPEELRALADESEFRAPDGGWTWTGPDAATEHLMSLAPALARLCAEFAGAFAQIEKLHHKDFDLAPQIASRALVKLSELKSVT